MKNNCEKSKFLSGRDKPIIAIDFDGTIKSTTDWRNMDTPPNVGCEEALLQLKNDGCYLILWTCRTGEGLAQAIHYLVHYGLIPYFDNINCNCVANKFETSNKIFADIYVDDQSLYPFKNWKETYEQISSRY